MSYGRRDAERTVGSVAPAHSRCGQRVEYEWDAAHIEWYINDTRGLEHGYTVQESQNVETSISQNGNLQFTLAVRGKVRLRVSGDGRNVAFVNENGATVVNYNGLTVFDATGAASPAWFEAVEGSDGRDDRTAHAVMSAKFLRIVVDDSAAAYPLSIDPIAQQAYLKASNIEAGDNFGSPVAVSGDTVVEGANGEEKIASDSGATYVFTGAGPPCCPGDMNGDSIVDALDIQPFVEKLLSGGVCP